MSATQGQPVEVPTFDRHRDLMRARPWAPLHCRVRHRLSSEPTPPPMMDQGADMATTTPDSTEIIGGVDTHQDLHTAAVVSLDGTVLGTESFSTTRAGYRAMLRWFRSFGELLRVGVESAGSYGAGITRHLALSGGPVLEVTGPDPAARRAKGKDDALDAVAASRGGRSCLIGLSSNAPLRARCWSCGPARTS